MTFPRALTYLRASQNVTSMKTEAIVIKFVDDMNLEWLVNMLDDRIRSPKFLTS